MSATEPRVSHEQRVCPECGRPPGIAAFCEQCGLNLADVERLPTYDEWRQARPQIAGDSDVIAIAASLNAISELSSPQLAGMRSDERRFDNPAVVELAKRAIVSKLESILAPGDHPDISSSETQPTADDRMSMHVVATVARSDGTRVEQRFVCTLPSGRIRLAVTRTGPPRLFKGNEDLGVIPLELDSSPAPASNTVSRGRETSPPIPRKAERPVNWRVTADPRSERFERRAMRVERGVIRLDALGWLGLGLGLVVLGAAGIGGVAAILVGLAGVGIGLRQLIRPDRI